MVLCGPENAMRKASLKRCRSLLLDQLSELEQHATIAVVEMTGEEGTALLPDPGDRAAIESDRSFGLRLKDRDRKLVVKIREALDRMQNGEYGVCEVCGGAIGEGRLLARPVTTQCLECKQEAELREGRG